MKLTTRTSNSENNRSTTLERSVINYWGFKLGLSNHARLDIRRFGSGIRIHPKVRIVYMRPYLQGICKTIL